MTVRIDNANDRRRELREHMALKAQATPWIPTQEGDELAGTVVARGQGNTRLGEVRDIIYVRQDDEAVRALWLMGAVLETEAGRKKVSVGDYIVVVYAGKRTSSTGRPYKHFLLEVDKPAEGNGNDPALWGMVLKGRNFFCPDKLKIGL